MQHADVHSNTRADQLHAEWQQQLRQQPQQHHKALAALPAVSETAPAAASGKPQTHCLAQQAALDTAATLPCMQQAPDRLKDWAWTMWLMRCCCM